MGKLRIQLLQKKSKNGDDSSDRHCAVPQYFLLSSAGVLQIIFRVVSSTTVVPWATAASYTEHDVFCAPLTRDQFKELLPLHGFMLIKKLGHGCKMLPVPTQKLGTLFFRLCKPVTQALSNKAGQPARH